MELEYRAKLVELSLAQESQQSTLQLICENQAKDKASAHAYANSKIVSALDSRLHINICNQSAGHEQAIRDGAARMLLDDSKSRHGQTKSRPD